MSGNTLHNIMFIWHMQRKAMPIIIYVKLVISVGSTVYDFSTTSGIHRKYAAL